MSKIPYPRYLKTYPPEDGNAARGCVIGVLISLPVWAVVIWLVVR